MPRSQPLNPCPARVHPRPFRTHAQRWLTRLVVAGLLPAVAVPLLPHVAWAKSKGQSASQLLHTIATHAPGKERDEAVDALIELGDAVWPEVRSKLDSIGGLQGGDDTVVDLLLGWGLKSYDEAVLRAPKLSDGPARRLVKQVLRYKEDARRAKLLTSLLQRNDAELLLLVLPELLVTDPPPVITRLIQLIDDPRQNLRAYAIDTLVSRKKDLDPATQQLAMQTMVRLLGIEQLKPSAENQTVRLKLVGAVARLGENTDAAVDPLLAALTVPDQRDAALEGLTQVGAPAVKAAIFLLRTADRGRLELALQVVSHLRAQAAPALLPMIQSPEPRTRNLAVDVLSHIAVPEVRGELIRLVRERKLTDLRQGLLLCLTLYDESVRQLLLDLLKDQDVQVRRLVVEQLWHLADPETYAALRHTATRDADMQTRKMAVQAMVGVGDPKGMELLRKLANANNQEERIAVLTTIGRVDGEAGIPALLAQLGDPSDDVFRAAVMSLRRLTLHSGPRREGEWNAWLAAQKDAPKDPMADVSTRQGRFTVDGRELTYLEASGGRDHTIIAVSGPPFRDSTHLTPHVWRLAEDSRVVALQRTAAERSAVTLSEADRSVELSALIDHLRVEKVVLLADAAGAHLAMTFATRHPELVSHVVLHGGPFPSAEALRRLPADVMAATPQPWRDDFQWALKQAGLLPADVRNRVLARALSTGLVADTDAARRLDLSNLFEDGLDVETLQRAIADAGTDGVRELKVPTLLLLGDKAPWVASALKDATEWNAAHKGGDNPRQLSVMKVRGASAFPLLESPTDATNAISNFLK